jgi:hypothetical protein
MAFEAKDGSKHSMASRMRARNSGIEAKEQTKPQEQILDQPGGEEDQPDGGDGGEAQGLSDPQQVTAAFQQVMDQVQQGQQPDPSMAKALCDYFEQFAQSEPSGDEGGESEGY